MTRVGPAVSTMEHERTDILIIGSGASGAAVAWRLAGSGFSVLCLEQGDWVSPSSYPNTSEDWEIRARGDWHFDPNMRGWDVDYPVNVDESCIDPLMFNAVGGSTIHYTAHVPRFHPSDFRVKSLDGVADDWPLSYFDLEPYYDLNDEMMGCSGINGDPANPPRKARPMPPVPIGEDGIRLAKAFDRLGWHWWPSDNYVNSEPYRGRLGVQQLRQHRPGMLARRERLHRCHLLARSVSARCQTSHRSTRFAHSHRLRWQGNRCDIHRSRRRRALPTCQCRSPGNERRGNSAHHAQLEVGFAS